VYNIYNKYNVNCRTILYVLISYNVIWLQHVYDSGYVIRSLGFQNYKRYVTIIMTNKQPMT